MDLRDSEPKGWIVELIIIIDDNDVLFVGF